MKKVLLSTSAIALVGAFSSSASAVEWDVDVGGYMEQWVSYSDADVDNMVFPDDDNFEGVDEKSDAEIVFVPSITLDNGIQFGANVQLEGNTSGDQIDESYMFIDGPFGTVQLGSENSAGYTMTYAAPNVTVIGVNSSSTVVFAPLSGTAGGRSRGADIFRGTLGSSFVEPALVNDTNRITYFTPRVFGFQAGASYARDAAEDSNAQINTDVPGIIHDIWDVGANYVNTFGAFDVAVSGRFGQADQEGTGDEPEVWAVGANLGYAGFTVGGSFAESNDHDALRANGEFWDVGAGYETGPWAFSVAYSQGENDDNEPIPFSLGGEEELQQAVGGVRYTLARGVALGAFGGWADLDEDVDDTGFGNGDDVETWFVGTSAALAF